MSRGQNFPPTGDIFTLSQLLDVKYMKFNMWHFSQVVSLSLVSLPPSAYCWLYPWWMTTDSICAMHFPINILLYVMSLPGCHLLFSVPGKLLLISSKSAEMSSSLWNLLSLPNQNCYTFPELHSMHTTHISLKALTTLHLTCFHHWMVFNLGAPSEFGGGISGGNSWWENVPCCEKQHCLEWRRAKCKLVWSASSQCVISATMSTDIIIKCLCGSQCNLGEKYYKSQTQETLVLRSLCH